MGIRGSLRVLPKVDNFFGGRSLLHRDWRHKLELAEYGMGETSPVPVLKRQ